MVKIKNIRRPLKSTIHTLTAVILDQGFFILASLVSNKELTTT